MGFFPPDTVAPFETRTEHLVLRPLTVDHVELDYEAVMVSQGQLRAWSQTTWPSSDFTLAENRADLERHAREHGEGIAFTYTVLNPTEARCLGCVYITPVPDAIGHLYASAIYAANVGFWIRTDELGNSLEVHLLTSLRAWFAKTWPFDRIVYSISQRGTRQAEILHGAGLERQAIFVLPDGRQCWAYSQSTSPHAG